MDRTCTQLFLARAARHNVEHFRDVERQVLKRGDELGNRAGVLELYRRVRSELAGVRDDEQSSVADVLRISGITRAAEGRLVVRNRIYERVFDRQWIRDHMPDPEVRRQRAAFRKGVLSAVSGAIFVAIILVWALVHAETERAKQVIEQADQMRLAEANGYREGVYSLRGKIQQMWFGPIFEFSEMYQARLREVVVGCMGNFSGFNPTWVSDFFRTRNPLKTRTSSIIWDFWGSGAHLELPGNSRNPRNAARESPKVESEVDRPQ